MYKETPPPATVWLAIETWLAIAHEGAAPPEVSALLAALRRHDASVMFESPVFERGAGDPPTRYALRLGNRAYPFMKLVIERLPTRNTWLFTADTHDRHICPAPGDPEHGAFTELMAHNRALAAKIEDAWRAQGIDTFRGFLDDDLARRRGERLSDRAKA
jgi:hypothetical protein